MSLRALFVSFYLHVLHLMECTVLVIVVSCYCCYYPPYSVLSLFASHPGFLSIVSVRICRIVSSHVSLYMHAYNSFFISPPTPSISSLNLSSLIRLFSGRKSFEIFFPDPPRSREIRASLALEDRDSKLINQSINRESSFQ